jgi:hypothetical protein
LRKDNDIATDDALCSGHPIWQAPAELARDSGSKLLGASLLQGSHCGSNPNGCVRMSDDDATDDALCSGILFGMRWLNLQETQVKCH